MRNLLRPVLGGLKSFVPGLRDRTAQERTPRGRPSARYCYAVWLRHLALLAGHGFTPAGAHAVELGPGDTLGVLLAALLSGARAATGLDVAPLATPARDRAMLADLVALFGARAAPPPDAEFPNLWPRVPWLTTLGQLVSEDALAEALAPDRVAHLARALVRAHAGGPAADAPHAADDAAARVRYHAPWTPDAVPPGGADLVMSQAVLEYLPHDGGPATALDHAFDAMRGWLRPGGWMSHQIDLAAPFGPEWNAHWAVGDAAWAVIAGRRPHYENRVPLSGYLALCARHGFDVLAADVTPAGPGVAPDRYAPRFRGLPSADYQARGVHLVARRR